MERETEQRRAQARDLVTGWVLAFWALGVGYYLTTGGVKHLVSPAYIYLMRLVNHDYHTVGVLLLIGGIVSVIGVVTRRAGVIGAGAIICGLWLAIIGLCMCAASFTVENAGNLNWTTSVGLSACFFIRAYNQIKPPRIPPIVMGMVTMAALWFI